jgi:hypothetical protein
VVIPVLVRLRQEDGELQVSLGYIVRPSQKTKISNKIVHLLSLVVYLEKASSK